MEIVYRGRHHSPERIVAIRMMKRTAFSSAGDVQRILNEANVASQMEHAAVVAFYGTRGCQGEPFITMKFNDGETLSRVLKCDEISRTDAIRKLCVADAQLQTHMALFTAIRGCSPLWQIESQGRRGLRISDWRRFWRRTPV
jgi:serine/threonine protein kinase